MKYRLEIDSVQLRYGHCLLLSDVYLSLETGTVTVIKGRNGSGKSSLFRILYGVQQAEAQFVRYNGRRIERAYLKSGLVRYLPQFSFVPGDLSVRSFLRSFEISCTDFLKTFDLPESVLRQRCGELSGGLRRLAEIYAVLKSDVKFVILDEPFTHLMPLHAEQVQALIAGETQKGILLTDHLSQYVDAVATERYELENGYLRKI